MDYDDIFCLVNLADGGSALDGLKYVYETVPERFSMILSKGEIITLTARCLV